MFKDATWGEILHVVAEFHSTLLHGQKVSPHLIEKKWDSMFDLHWKAPKFNKDKGWFLDQRITLIITIRRQLHGKNKRNLKNKKIKKIAVECHFLPSSFYPLEVVFLKLGTWL